MEKLPWFKFNPSNWIMGKIQRCSEITQARFLRLCCVYWNNECEMLYEDAEIEIDTEHLDSLINKKVVKFDGNTISIEFLDEQYLTYSVESKNKSQAGVIGNLKRWHKDIYDRFSKGEVSLDDALKIITNQSHTDNTPITDQSQNIAEKRREEEIREEEKENQEANGSHSLPLAPVIEKTQQEIFLDWFNNRVLDYSGKMGKTKILSKTDENNLKKLRKSYPKMDDWNTVFKNMWKSKWCIETNNRTATHLLRVDNFNKYLSQENPFESIIDKHKKTELDFVERAMAEAEKSIN